MKQNYKDFVDRMITRYEGGYGWDANDPGGPTKYGITCYDLAEHRHELVNDMTVWAPRVKAMPLSEAEDIYASKYATACAFDELNSGADCVVMDFSVNSGLARAIRYAQLVTDVHMDGVMGPITITAINHMPAGHFIDALCNARLGFLHALATWHTFGTGWGRRVADLRAYSHKLARPATAWPDTRLIVSASRKAMHIDDELT
jgi:lysozyme family protein